MLGLYNLRPVHLILLIGHRAKVVEEYSSRCIYDGNAHLILKRDGVVCHIALYGLIDHRIIGDKFALHCLQVVCSLPLHNEYGETGNHNYQHNGKVEEEPVLIPYLHSVRLWKEYP